jgi:eukaryotic-like serine/threonine-protein kinase
VGVVSPGTVLERYELGAVFATGGMASVHVGRATGPDALRRPLAIKRLHPTFARSPEVVSMLLDEASLLARVEHPNVVRAVEVVRAGDEVYVVLEYVRGETLAGLMGVGRSERSVIEASLAAAILTDVLAGLHAAHDARDDQGSPLGIIHRDVSPQNIIVGADGHARLLDFGIAKALRRGQLTRPGDVKGKLEYMAPEQLEGHEVDRRTDVFAAGVVLWEMLTGRSLFGAETEGATIMRLLAGQVPAPSELVPTLPKSFDEVVQKATRPAPADRYASADEMSAALESSVPRASPRSVAAWVQREAKQALADRDALVAKAFEARTSEAAGSPFAPEPAAEGSAHPTVSTHKHPRARRSVAPVALGGAAVVALLALATHRLSTSGSPSPSPSEPQASRDSAPDAAAIREPPAVDVAPPMASSEPVATTGPAPSTAASGLVASVSAAPSAAASGAASAVRPQGSGRPSCTRTLPNGAIVLRPECQSPTRP